MRSAQLHAAPSLDGAGKQEADVYPGCIVVHYDMEYKSQRGFKEILADYRTELEAAGWEPSPTHRHDRNYVDFYVLGSQTLLTISTSPLVRALLTPSQDVSEPSHTCCLSLAYYSPSKGECSG